MFGALTGLRAVVRAATGEPIGGDDPGPRFCRLARAKGAASDECRECLRAAAPPPGDLSPRLCECPLGLLVGIARIPGGEGDATWVTCGQVVPAELDAAGRARLVARAAERGGNPAALRAALREVPVLTRPEMLAALALLQALLQWRATRLTGQAPEARPTEGPVEVMRWREALQRGDLELAREVAATAADTVRREKDTALPRARALSLIAAFCESAVAIGLSPVLADGVARRAAAEALAADSIEALAEAVRQAAAELSRGRGADEETPSAPIRRALAYIEQHYAHDLTLNEVARHVALSPAYFSALFKRECGVGFKQYLQGVRLGAARRLLEEPTRSLDEIAGAVGYGDVHYFSRVFSRAFGEPPGRFRRRRRGP